MRIPTFRMLVTECKVMLGGNLTSPQWLRRSQLWNLVALQSGNGTWSATDALAASLRAADPTPTLAPPLPGKKHPVRRFRLTSG